MKKNLKPDIQLLLTYLQPNDGELTNRMRVLETFLSISVATADLIVWLTQLTYKQVVTILNDLVAGSYQRPAALREIRVALEGQMGRPKKVYRLTEAGDAVLRACFGSDSPQISQAEESIELQHLLCHAMVYGAAHIAGYPAQIEQVIHFDHDSSYLRPDVAVEGPEKRLILFENEQYSPLSNRIRILEKLKRYACLLPQKRGKEFRAQSVSFSTSLKTIENLENLAERHGLGCPNSVGGQLPCPSAGCRSWIL